MLLNIPKLSFGKWRNPINLTFLLFKKAVLKNKLFNGWELSKNAAPFIDLYFYVSLAH